MLSGLIRKQSHITEPPSLQQTPCKPKSRSPSQPPSPSKTLDTFVTATDAIFSSSQSTITLSNHGSPPSSTSCINPTTDVTLTENIQTKFSDKDPLEVNFTSSPPATHSNSSVTTSDPTSSTLCETPSIPHLQTELPTLFTVADPSTNEPSRKRQRSSLIPLPPSTPLAPGKTYVSISTQTSNADFELVHGEDNTQSLSASHSIPKVTPMAPNEPLATIMEETVVISDTEMEDDDCIPIVNELPDQIIITKADETNSMQMARDYFGGKPFTGQQKITNEKYPTRD
ncbi:hypothetical protein SNEBB_005867, partial [Seison nebaliae]